MDKYIISKKPQLRTDQDTLEFLIENSKYPIDLLNIINNYLDYDTKWIIGDRDCLNQNVDAYDYFHKYNNFGTNYRVEHKKINKYHRFPNKELNWQKLFFLTQKLNMLYENDENELYEFLVTKDFYSSNMIEIHHEIKYFTNFINIKTKKSNFKLQEDKNSNYSSMIHNLASNINAKKIIISTNKNNQWIFDNSNDSYDDLDNNQFNIPFNCHKLIVPSLKGFTVEQLIYVKEITISHIDIKDIESLDNILSNLPNLQKLTLKGDAFLQYSSLSKPNRIKFNSKHFKLLRVK